MKALLESISGEAVDLAFDRRPRRAARWPGATFFPPASRVASNPAKRTLDLVLAAAALVALSPCLLLIAVLIRLGSPGPAIFRQARTGLCGDHFTIYKFRTMRLSDQNVAAVEGDERITWFGALLRRTSIDELPQLLNVLQGTMSLVGPRPHAIDHEALYFREIPGYAHRFRVRPGLTGLAQVSGSRGGSEIEEITERVEIDERYIRNWSLLEDIRIILMTLPHMLFYRAI